MPSDFISSPADVAGPHKANLQDFKVTEEETKAFKELCKKYSDVFSENSGDIGRTLLIKWILTPEKILLYVKDHIPYP